MNEKSRKRKRCSNCEQGVPVEAAPRRADAEYRLKPHSPRGTDSLCLGSLKPVEVDDFGS